MLHSERTTGWKITNIYRRLICIDNMSSDVTCITSSHGAWEPPFLTSWVTQSGIMEEQHHELERRKIVSYGCFYFSHINGGWHQFYDLVDCSVLRKLSLRRHQVWHRPHAHVDTANPVTDEDMGESTLHISYNSHSVSLSFVPPRSLPSFWRTFRQ